MLAQSLVYPSDDPELENDGWIRFGINLVNDTSRQQVYLPKAGVYLLFLADSRTLLSSIVLATGGDDACYFATVTNVGVPQGEVGVGRVARMMSMAPAPPARWLPR